MPDVFYTGSDWEQSSGPIVNVEVHEEDVWPVDDNSGSGVKDVLEAGMHPVLAIGKRTDADGRPANVTGVVMTYTPGRTTSLGIVEMNIACGMIVRQYVANILDYSALDYETAPVLGQPVFVDDNAALGEGVTLSMANETAVGLMNPMAGVLWYCQDEMANSEMGGGRTYDTFDHTLADTLVEQIYCVLLMPLGHQE